MLPTSGTITKAVSIIEIIKLTQNNHLRNVKYEATTVPKCDSISFIRNSQGIKRFIKLIISRFVCCHFCNNQSNGGKILNRYDEKIRVRTRSEILYLDDENIKTSQDVFCTSTLLQAVLKFAFVSFHVSFGLLK